MRAAISRPRWSSKCRERRRRVVFRRIREAHDLEQVRVEWSGERAARAHAHGAERIAVIGVLEGDDEAAALATVAPVLQRHLERDFNGRGAIIRVEDARQSLRRDANEFPGERDGGLVGKAGEDHLFQSMRLGGDGRGDGGMRMTVQRHPPG